MCIDVNAAHWNPGRRSADRLTDPASSCAGPNQLAALPQEHGCQLPLQYSFPDSPGSAAIAVFAADATLAVGPIPTRGPYVLTMYRPAQLLPPVRGQNALLRLSEAQLELRQPGHVGRRRILPALMLSRRLWLCGRLLLPSSAVAPRPPSLSIDCPPMRVGHRGSVSISLF